MLPFNVNAEFDCLFKQELPFATSSGGVEHFRGKFMDMDVAAKKV